MEEARKAVLADSVSLRIQREIDKAREKYGEISLLPGGNPEYDIIDYTINEVVGLHRYGEMLQARADEHEAWSPEARSNLREIGAALRRFSLEYGHELIAVRQHLLVHGHHLGKAETRA